MDGVSLGLRFRALRVNADLRQADVEARTGVSRRWIGELERGVLTHVSVDDLGRIAGALGASLDVRLRWNGEQLDRLLDASHAATVAAALDRLGRLGWESAVEVSFSIWGERGSIDILARHPGTATVLVVEVKSVIPDLQAMLHDLDRKARLARAIAEARGWHTVSVARLLVVAESATSRQRVRRHDGVLRVALPDRGSVVRQWLAAPSGRPLRGIMFLSNVQHSHTGLPIWRRQRVRPLRSRRRCGARTYNEPDAPKRQPQD